MEHALTSVKFEIAGNGEKVKAIAIQGVSPTGTLTVDGSAITWSNLGPATTTDFSASLNYDEGSNVYTTTPTMTTNLIAGNGYLMMIPQTLTDDAMVIVTYSDNTIKKLDLSSVTWAPGQILTYNITLTFEGGDADILYFGADNRLSIGRWGTDVTDVTKMVFTQFGSVVGFTNGTAWDNSDILFNPTTDSYDDYTTIPNYGKPTATWTGSANTSPLVYEPAYHNGANILAGRGDICKLVGLTSAQAKSMTAAELDAYQSGWRLPTAHENIMFIGQLSDGITTTDQYIYTGGNGTASNPGTWTILANKYYQAGVHDVTLPGTGNRAVNSAVVFYIDRGLYWSATPTGSDGAHTMFLYPSIVYGNTGDQYAVGFANRCIRTGEDPTPLTPVGGVLAAPGVIGYIKGTNTLTLKGSTEYKTNPDIKKYADDNFGGLSTETVYAAYFKFGSLVAISGDPTDGNPDANGNYIQSDDIIAAPSMADGYIGIDALKENIANQTIGWSQLPVSSSLSGGATIGTSLVDGLGDPCDYYFGDGDGNASSAGSTWRLPTGTPYNGTPDYSLSNTTWYAAGDLDADLPAGRLSTRTDETGMFYPLTGYRTSGGGAIGALDGDGNYWSSTASSASQGYALHFTSSGINSSFGANNNAAGFTVRCVLPTITVDPTTHLFPSAGGTEEFTVTTTNFTNTPAVTAIDDATGTAADWLTTSWDDATTLSVTAAPNTSTTASRTATITLTADTATTTVTITQNATPTTDNTPNTVITTVGAFWKKSQTGERIVTIPTPSDVYAGDWSAWVVEYGSGFSAGDILMVAGDSDDAASIATDTYTDPENRQVSAYPTAAYIISGTATTTSGIKFRVFMDSTWSGSVPRYAKIAVSYGEDYGYTRMIYIRQGEDADYLMRPGDAGTGVGSRTLAAKFSPYNLTDPDFTGLTGSTAQRGSTTAPRSDVFTDYPSQAGAFYKWAETAGVVAYNPAVPNSGAVSGWVGRNTVTAYWNSTGGAYEGCPAGYRRPTDGSTASAVNMGSQGPSNSEVGQSFHVNPRSGSNVVNNENLLSGYYSDGWFDRFIPGLQTAYPAYPGTANTAVSRDKSTVAYAGLLYYNPNDNTSLFIPMPGIRMTDSYLDGPGGAGYYWTSSATNTDVAIKLELYFWGDGGRSTNSRYNAFPVRCVVAE
jgi:hypothetical protein